MEHIKYRKSDVFVIVQSKKFNIVTPSVTFDQPLWTKVVEIIAAKKLNIVPILGGFHTLMSFLGSIGKIMEGSGLDQLFETVYGQNAVKHILSGKAVSRANRGHILIEATLMNHLQQLVMEEDLKEQSSEILQDIEKLYDEIMAGAELVNLDTPSLNKLNESVQNLRKRLGKESRTAKLWLQYMDYVAIYRLYIRAARTRNWNLHLSSTSKMLNLFGATGHIHYAKPARLYLQMMAEPWRAKYLDFQRMACSLSAVPIVCGKESGLICPLSKL